MAGQILADISLRLRASSAELQKGLDAAKSSIAGFKGQVSGMGKSMSGAFKEATSNIKGSLNAMTNGLSGMLQTGLSVFKGLITGVKGFAAAFAATGIGAIILAVSAAIMGLVAAFKRSGTASDKMEEALGYLKGILSYLINLLVKVGEWVVKAFETEAVKNFFVTVKDVAIRTIGFIGMIASSIKLIIDAAIGAGLAIAGIFSKEAREKSKEWAEKVNADIEKVGKNAKMMWTGEPTEEMKKFGAELKAAGEEGVRIAKLDNDLWAKKTAIVEQNGKAELKLSALKEEMAKVDRTSSEGMATYSDLINKALIQQGIINKNNIALAEAEYEIAKAKATQKSGENLVDEDNYNLAVAKAKIDEANAQASMANAALLRRETQIDIKAQNAAEKAAEDAIKVQEKAAEQAIKDSEDLLKLQQENTLLTIEDKRKVAEESLKIDRDNALAATENADIKLAVEENYRLKSLALAKEFYDEDKKLSEEAAKDKLSRELSSDTLTFAAKKSLLEQGYADGLVKEAEYQDSLKELKLERNQAYADSAVAILSIVSDFQQAAMNRELAAAGDNEVKKEAILKRYGKKQKAMAIAQAIINGALAITNLIASIPGSVINPATWAGIAIAAATTAAQVGLIASQPLAKGGIAYGESLATVGEYANARTNPEVIAPLSKLKDILFKTPEFGEVRFVIEQNQLVGILERYNKKNIYF